MMTNDHMAGYERNYHAMGRVKRGTRRALEAHIGTVQMASSPESGEIQAARRAVLDISGSGWIAVQVSPHELMQAVMSASGKRFTIEKQSDPVDFLTWLLNTLHVGLTDGKRSKPSVITRCFQGELKVTTEAGTGAQPPHCLGSGLAR